MLFNNKSENQVQHLVITTCSRLLLLYSPPSKFCRLFRMPAIFQTGQLILDWGHSYLITGLRVLPGLYFCISFNRNGILVKFARLGAHARDIYKKERNLGHYSR